MIHGNDWGALVGKTIMSVICDQDTGGYDRFRIELTDGYKLEVLEQSQTGYFSVSVKVSVNSDKAPPV